MSPFLPPLSITIRTTVGKLFYFLLVVELLIKSKKKFLINTRKKPAYLFTNP